MKKFSNDQKGFTLAELLIVVAIIAVLAAISIPILSSRLESSRESTDIANLRAAYAAAQTAAMTKTFANNGESVSALEDLGSGNLDGSVVTLFYGSGGDLTISSGAAIKGEGTNTDAKTKSPNTAIKYSSGKSANGGLTVKILIENDGDNYKVSEVFFDGNP